MLDLKEVYYFVQVVNRGGFAAASRSLQIPKSTLSYRIQQLESSLGVRLVNRTSRRFSMTDVGREFYQHARILLKDAEDIEDIVRQRLAEPSGIVRMTTPLDVSQFALREILPAFMLQHPKVEIHQQSTDVLIDIVEEGFDLALRGHSSPLPDSSLVQRTIARVPWFLYAGTRYLDSIGFPETPEDLIGCNSIGVPRDNAWQLQHSDGRRIDVGIQPRFVSNDMVALKQAACAGLGIVSLPHYVGGLEVQSGELKQVLPGWITRDSSVTALMPFRHGLLPAVRALVDFLAVEFPKAAAVQHRENVPTI
ncbi:LysR family transcriptional regulator [Ensifer adhaerens]|uniref:LysR substrate-binding domain-containing protein n=1 Tax=Ensifer adhaerens TaxID=106592 RepID=UPI001CBEB45F|nr:LysR substrate-binding domain-containing protein [Ensifer adhaerens]MBZ7924804.1 LysR family transcriptional regulator [Ensifer adhaerens]UAX95974.1 LysR family transcriptional regulator [Ensifer adhaerens]UAY04684.1 LysR family transcriptional regulator [Ensifer adhaerens]UAY10115.1 LysR family transcriptional regulator [Ensifer adhaerens]